MERFLIFPNPVPVVISLAVALIVVLATILWLVLDGRKRDAARARDEEMRRDLLLKEEDGWLR